MITYFKLAQQVDTPETASEIIVLGLDAMSLSAAVSMAEFEGHGDGQGAAFAHAVEPLISELGIPLEKAGSRELNALEREGAIIGDTTSQHAAVTLRRSLSSIADIASQEGQSPLTDAVRLLVARTLEAYVHSLSGRQSNEQLDILIRLMNGSENWEQYQDAYYEYGGMGADILAHSLMAQLVTEHHNEPNFRDPKGAYALGLTVLDDIESRNENARSSRSLLTAINTAHDVAFLAGTARDLLSPGTPRTAAEEYRARYSELIRSYGSLLLDDIFFSDDPAIGDWPSKIRRYESLIDASYYDELRGAAADIPQFAQDWSDFGSITEELLVLTAAIDSRRGGLIHGPRRRWQTSETG